MDFIKVSFKDWSQRPLPMGFWAKQKLKQKSADNELWRSLGPGFSDRSGVLSYHCWALLTFWAHVQGMVRGTAQLCSEGCRRGQHHSVNLNHKHPSVSLSLDKRSQLTLTMSSCS